MPMNRLPLKFPLHTREACLREAIKISHDVHCDQLDCSINIARQPTDKTPEQVLELGMDDRRTHYHFIRRDGYPLDGPLYEDGYYDVGLSTMFTGSPPDYFLWIKLTLEQGERMIEKYGIYEPKY